MDKKEDDELDDADIRTDRPALSVVFTSFDQALRIVGPFGRYQWSFFLALQVGEISFSYNICPKMLKFH